MEELSIAENQPSLNGNHHPYINSGLDTSLDSISDLSLVNRKNNNSNGGYKVGMTIDPTAIIFQEFGRMYSMSKKGNFLSSLKDTRKKVDKKLFKQQVERKREGIHIIDRISRYLYPLSFLVFNVIYFTYALLWHSSIQT